MLTRIDTANQAIDKVEALLKKHNAMTGLGGKITRPGEVVSNWFGNNETDRATQLRSEDQDGPEPLSPHATSVPFHATLKRWLKQQPATSAACRRSLRSPSGTASATGSRLTG